MNEPHLVSFDAHGVKLTLRFRNASDHIARTIEQAGTFYEAELLADIWSRLFYPVCAIDVGAHVGNHTLYFANVLGARTIAFEPNPETFALLEQNVRENGLSSKCELHHVAAGANAGPVRVGTVPETNSGMAYVEADPAGTIACVRLDDVLANEPEIDVIKIDVEGWELEVLRGAGSLIRHHRPLLYVEITEARFAETRELLDRYGYVGWKRFNATPTFLFLPKERFAAAGT